MITKIEYFLDEDGENWITQQFVNIKEINFGEISNGFNSCIIIPSKKLLEINTNVSIRIEKNDGYYGILVELLEED